MDNLKSVLGKALGLSDEQMRDMDIKIMDPNILKEGIELSDIGKVLGKPAFNKTAKPIEENEEFIPEFMKFLSGMFDSLNLQVEDKQEEPIKKSNSRMIDTLKANKANLNVLDLKAVDLKSLVKDNVTIEEIADVFNTTVDVIKYIMDTNGIAYKKEVKPINVIGLSGSMRAYLVNRIISLEAFNVNKEAEQKEIAIEYLLEEVNDFAFDKKIITSNQFVIPKIGASDTVYLEIYDETPFDLEKSNALNEINWFI